MTNLHKKGGAALVTAALIVLTLGAALVFTACPNNAGGSGSGGGTPPTPKHAVTFGVDGGHGTLKAKADGGTETEMSPINVEKGKTVTFTAVPDTNYKVKEWKLDGAVVAGNTTSTHAFTVTKAAEVKVSFEALPPGQWKSAYFYGDRCDYTL